MTPLRTEALAVGYATGPRRTRVVLADLDLTVDRGELVCLVGPNGSGKSTLLRTVAGMQPPLHGRALLAGDDVTTLSPPERAQRLAVVLTDPVDVGVMVARDLVALGRYPHTGWSGRLSAADWSTVEWAMAAAGAGAFAARPVAELSDGERQRVLIARALAQQPTLLVLDEAVAMVDVPRRVELVTMLRQLAHECGLAVVLTTHDLDLAVRHADTLWLLEAGDGPNRVAVGAPEDLVLAGAVSRAFVSAEVHFDVERGAFVAPPSRLLQVAVTGRGPEVVWTRRAMEREGLTVVEDAALTVVVADGRWTLRSPAGAVTTDTIGALVAQLRGLLPRLAGDPVEPRP